MLVFVQLQEQSGIQRTRLVIVHLDYMVLNVLLVISQESGKMLLINVFALLLKQFGTKQFNNVNVRLDYMDQNVNNAQPQENGTTIQILVIAQHQ